MFFNKFKKIDNNRWGEAYQASPRVYAKPDGEKFGAIALTENTLTALPKDPKSVYKVGGQTIKDWKLVLVSTTTDSVIANVDYYEAMNKMQKHIVESNENSYLVEALTLDTMKSLID